MSSWHSAARHRTTLHGKLRLKRKMGQPYKKTFLMPHDIVLQTLGALGCPICVGHAWLIPDVGMGSNTLATLAIQKYAGTAKAQQQRPDASSGYPCAGQLQNWCVPAEDCKGHLASLVTGTTSCKATPRLLKAHAATGRI